jgi:hypothetical protein
MAKQRIYPIAWHFVDEDGETKEFFLTQEGLAHLAEKGCTCRPIPMPDIGVVMIGGEDDCPVHGFGVEEESAA